MSKFGFTYREKELDVDEEYDVDGGLDMYESRKKKGTKVCLLCMLCTWHVQRAQFNMSGSFMTASHICNGHISLVGWSQLVTSASSYT